MSSPFMESVRRAIRVRHYSIRTETAYLGWIRRFILHHGKRHPADMGEAEVGDFLTHLATVRNVSANTQNQALNALVFLYKAVLDQPLGDIQGVTRAKKPQRLPVVLSRDEIKAVLRELSGVHWLIACLQYGSGLRLMESVRLRIQDLDFDRCSLTVRHGKGGKDRVVTLAKELTTPLQRAHENGQDASKTESGGGMRHSLSAPCSGEEVPQRDPGVELTIPVSDPRSERRPPNRDQAPSPPGCLVGPTGGEDSRSQGRHPASGKLP